MHLLVYFYLTVGSIYKSICLIQIAVKAPKLFKQKFTYHVYLKVQIIV